MAPSYEKSACIDSFGKDSGSQWKCVFSSNMIGEAQFGWTDPAIGIDEPLLKLNLRRRNSALGPEKGSYFSISRNLQVHSSWKDADGIGVVLSTEKPEKAWRGLNLGLKVDGQWVGQPLFPDTYPGEREWVTRIMPFAQFKSQSGDRIADTGKIESIRFGGVGPNDNILFIKEMFLYKYKPFIKKTLIRAHESKQYRKIVDIDTFSKDSQPDWKFIFGDNAGAAITFGWPCSTADGVISLLRVRLQRKSTSLAPSKGNYFNCVRKIKKGLLNKDADGICIVLAVGKPEKWYLGVALRVGDKVFRQAVSPDIYDKGSVLVTRILPFSKFKSNSGESITDIEKITSLKVGGGAPRDNTLYLKEIYLYKIDKGQYSLNFFTNKPRINVFAYDEPVEITLKGTPLKNCRGVRLEIRDYFNKTVYKTEMKSSQDNGQIIYKCHPGLLPSGYYDAMAWPLDNNGNKLYSDSCIASRGNLDRGRGAFAVMPCTLKQNKARRLKYLSTAFFGLHGNYLNLADLVGVSWRNRYRKWPLVEPCKPEVLDNGLAKWASDWIINSKTEPPENLHELNLALNCHGIPAWAASKTPMIAPGLKDWSSFLNFFKNYIAVEKHLYPYMKKRIYNVAWEVNLNSPHSRVHSPIYRPGDVVELYKKARVILKDQDENGILIGPCASTVDSAAWTESLFKAGLIKYIDGFDIHGYHAPPPEKSGLAKKIRELQCLIRKYNAGKDMDIYCTELGYLWRYGTDDRHKEQAQWHVRAATILKGEGVRAYFPFNPVVNNYGLCYYLDDKFTWNLSAIAPKAAIPGLAVCADQLEGAVSLGEMSYFGSDIYSYLFKKEGKPILTMWSVEEPHKVRLCVGQNGSNTRVEVVNIMGVTSLLTPKDGCVTLSVSNSIIYVKGLPEILYGKRPSLRSIAVKVYPGEMVKAKLTKKSVISSVRGIDVTHGIGNDFSISVKKDVLPGIYPLFGTSPLKWIEVKTSLQIAGVKPAMEAGNKGVAFAISNKSSKKVKISICVSINSGEVQTQTVSVAGVSIEKVFFPLSNIAPGKSYLAKIEVRAAGMSTIRMTRKLNFLAAHKRAESAAGKLPNSISWHGKGSSGRNESATAVIEWDKLNLYLDVTVNDVKHIQTRSDSTIWIEDCIQVAFDTDPEQRELYNPLGGILTKKITEVAFALNNKGKMTAWRHRTYDKACLKTGNVSSSIKMNIIRDSVACKTNYRIDIPWQEIGLTPRDVRKGKLLGIDIFVNDKDPGDLRKGLELFGGIMKDKDHSLFGNIILE